jgi:hypothetical protein
MVTWVDKSFGGARRQVEALRCDIRRREWEDAARKALAGKSSLTALQEALSDAPTMAATDSPLLKALRCRFAQPLNPALRRGPMPGWLCHERLKVLEFACSHSTHTDCLPIKCRLVSACAP